MTPSEFAAMKTAIRRHGCLALILRLQRHRLANWRPEQFEA